jgi:hypothetical protein
MPRKEKTPEEKKAWGEKMKAAREAKKQAEPSPETTNSGEVSLSDLLKQVQEIREENTLLRAAVLQKGPQVTDKGVVGTFEKYVTDPGHYPDPRERLSSEPRLEQFAFKSNWELGWKIEDTRYQTIDGVWEKQPKFTLQLIYKVRDDETGELTNRRAGRAQLIFFEDPVAAISVARENGLPVEGQEERTFLNEMRYLRARDWLIECFLPPKPQSNKNKREMVIGGRLMDVWEISGDEEKIPFDQLNSKL